MSAPKCPECRALLAVSLVSCANCGWKQQPVAAPVPPPVPPERERFERNPELSRKLHQLALDLAKRWNMKQALMQKQDARRMGAVEVIKGHGYVCTCEHCWPTRINPKALRDLRALQEAEEREPGNDDEEHAA